MPNIFITRLRTALSRRDLTQSELARRLQTPISTIQRWLRGAVPRRHLLNALAQELSVSPEWLLGTDGAEPSEVLREAEVPFRVSDAQERWINQRNALEDTILKELTACVRGLVEEDDPARIKMRRQAANSFLNDYFQAAAELAKQKNNMKF